MKFKWQNPNIKSNPKPQCQNVFQNDQLFIFFPLCIFISVGCVWINGWTYIFKHLSFDIHLKFACPVKSVSYFTGGLLPLSFKFILFTYLDPFRVTIEATPFSGGSWLTSNKRASSWKDTSSPNHTSLKYFFFWPLLYPCHWFHRQTPGAWKTRKEAIGRELRPTRTS